MPHVLLDTDILSEVLKAKRPELSRRAEEYLRQYQRLSFSAITLYEIERGLLAKRATRLLSQFDVIAQASNVLTVSVSVLRRAAALWSNAKVRGQPQNDADLIIAATALEYDLALVTGNRRHFEWIDDLRLETWD
jgi:tRNA(fMet)-specific endonuclease VapC